MEKTKWDLFEIDLKEFLQKSQMTKERDYVLSQINIAKSVGEYDEAVRILKEAIKNMEI